MVDAGVTVGLKDRLACRLIAVRVPRLAGALATAWRDRQMLGAILGQIARALEKTGRVERRRKYPSAFQVIGNPTECGYGSNA